MKATKLKSGRYRARAYDYQDENGKQHFKSFTADTKKEAEMLALQYESKKKSLTNSANVNKLTLGEVVDNYIELQRPLLSPATIHAYERYRQYGFKDLMLLKIASIDNLTLRNAVAVESTRLTDKGTQISAKTVKNEYSLIKAALKVYAKDIDADVPLPRTVKKIVDLPTPEEVYNAVKGSNIELAVLLAMWLSFSMSEIKGLKRSSISGDYITINQVMIRVGTKHIEKELAKVDTRIRRHKIPPYIASLIASAPIDTDYIVPITANAINARLRKLLAEHNVKYISFHKLRHINASTLLTRLNISEKITQERGGWSTNATMKSVYEHSFTEDRKEADEKIDEYFNSVVGQKMPFKKYTEFIKYMDVKDVPEVKEIYNQLKQYKK